MLNERKTFPFRRKLHIFNTQQYTQQINVRICYYNCNYFLLIIYFHFSFDFANLMAKSFKHRKYKIKIGTEPVNMAIILLNFICNI